MSSNKIRISRERDILPTAKAEGFRRGDLGERDFKSELLKTFPKVQIVYPGLKVKPTDDGLLLSPSPTPISARARSGVQRKTT